jgi:hypothetical protein
MHPLRVPIALVGAALAVAASAADASICYIILDAKETIVYRAAIPPVDMSDRGAAARDALRQKGNYLLFMETEQCVPIGFGSGWANSSQAPFPDYASNTRSITAPDEGAVARAPAIRSAKPTAATPADAAAPAAPRRATAPPAY